jgi:transcriptional regulator with XRE-family HTH domain
MAKASQPSEGERDAYREEVAKWIERVRALSGKNLNEFAEAVGRDPRQVSRWLKGEERPHIDAIWASEQLQEPMLVALAERIGRVKVTTQITVEKRIA